MGDVADFANWVFDDMGLSGISTVSSISGWAESNLGSLNLKLDTKFTVDSSGNFKPSFGNTESGIYKEIYAVKFYGDKAYKAMHGVLDNDNDIQWISIREGDTSIQQVNKSEIVKSLKSLQKDAREELDKLVNYYRRNTSRPISVSGDDVIYK